MSWSREQITVLIDSYKMHPGLYVVKYKEYKNKHARNAALEQIERELKTVRPTTTIAKVNGLRTNFLTEHRKYLKSFHSGMGEDEISKPNLWYYEALQFLLEHVIPRQSIDAIDDQIEKSVIRPALQDDVVSEAVESTLADLENVEIEYVDNKLDDKLENKCLEKRRASPTALETKKRKGSKLNKEDDVLQQHRYIM